MILELHVNFLVNFLSNFERIQWVFKYLTVREFSLE